VKSCSEKKTEDAPSENHPTAVAQFSNGTRRLWPAILFGISFVAAWSVRAVVTESAPSFASLFVLILATVITLIVLNQQLPLQNIVALIVAVTIFSGATMLGAGALRISFDPPIFNREFSLLPAWSSPLLWTVALVNARGIAKLFLRQMRRESFYGWSLIALSSVLVAGFNLSAEPDWKISGSQFVLASIAFVATTPWFIDKKPVERAPDYQPLFITILLLLW
jgi:hypothetical protein